MGATSSTEVGKVVVVDDGVKGKASGATDVVKISTEDSRLLFRGNSVNDRDLGGNTSLHRSVKSGDLDAAQLALALGADVNIQNQGGCTALHVAVADENEEMTQLLVDGESDEGEVDLDVHNDDGLSPLHVAVMKDNVCIVSSLIKSGASILGRTGDGQTPLELAISSGNHNAAQFLCQVLQDKILGVQDVENQYRSETFFLNAVRSFQILGLIGRYKQDIQSLRNKVQNLAQDKYFFMKKLSYFGVNSMVDAYATKCHQQQSKEVIEQLQMDKQNLQVQVEALRKENNMLLQENNCYLEQVDEKLMEIGKLQEEKWLAQQLNIELQKDVVHLREELLMCKNSGDVMSSMLQDVQSEIQDLQEQVIGMVSNEGQHISDNYQLQLHTQRQAAQNLELSTEIGELQALVLDLQKLHQAKQQECDVLKTQFQSLHESQMQHENSNPTIGVPEKDNVSVQYTQEQVQWLLDDRKKLREEKKELRAQLCKLGQVEGGSSFRSMLLSKEISDFQDSNDFDIANSYSTNDDAKSGLTAIVHKSQHTPRSMLVRSDSEESGRELEELRMQLQELITQNSEFQQQLEQLKQDKILVQQSNKDMLEEVQYLREHYDEMQFENVQLKSEVQELKDMQTDEVLNKRVLARAPSLYKELSGQYEAQIKQLNSLVEKLQAEKLCSQQVLQGHSQEDVEFLKLEHQVVESIQLVGLEYAREEYAKLNNKILYLELENANLKCRVGHPEDQEEELKAQIKELKEENEQLKDCKSKLEEQLCCLQADYEDSEISVLQLRQVQQLLEDGNVKSHQDNCKLREQVRVLTAQISQMAVEKEQDATFYDESNKQAQQKVLEFVEEIALKDSKLLKFEKMNLELEKRVSIIAEQLQEKKELQNKVVLLEDKCVELQNSKTNESEDLRKQGEQHIQEIVDLKKTISQLQAQESSLKHKLNEAIKEKIERQKEVEELEVIADETEEAVIKFQNENRGMQATMDSMQQALCDLESQKNESEVQVTELQGQLKQLHDENNQTSQLVQNMQQLVDDSILKHGFQDTDKDGLVHKLGWFLQQVHNKLSETEANKQELQQKNNALMKNMEGVRIQFSELQKVRDRYAQQIQQQQLKITTLQAHTPPQQLLEQVLDLNNNRKKMMEEVSDLRTTVGELQAERLLLQHEKDSLRTEMTEEFNRMKSQYEQQIRCLSQSKSKRSKSNEDLDIFKNYKKLAADYEKTNETNKMVLDKLHAAERNNENLRDLNDSLIKKIKKNNNELQKAEREQRRLIRICSKAEEAREVAAKENDKLLTSVQQLSKEQKQNMEEVDKLMFAVQEFEKDKEKLMKLENDKEEMHGKLQQVYGMKAGEQ